MQLDHHDNAEWNHSLLFYHFLLCSRGSVVSLDAAFPVHKLKAEDCNQHRMDCCTKQRILKYQKGASGLYEFLMGGLASFEMSSFLFKSNSSNTCETNWVRVKWLISQICLAEMESVKWITPSIKSPVQSSIDLFDKYIRRAYRPTFRRTSCIDSLF